VNLKIPSLRADTVTQANDLAATLQGYTSSIPTTDEALRAFAADVDRGLRSRPKRLDCKYLYDQRGSELFEAICDLPEYYLTRTETQILTQVAEEIAAETGPLTLVELGAGTSRKSQLLLDAYCGVDPQPDYVAVDVSSSALDKGARTICENLPTVRFHPLCTSYQDAFSLLSKIGKTMVVFLGSTIGNFSARELDDFFQQLAVNLVPGDYFLLGVDLHKDVRTLEAAYNDSAGVTQLFTRNLFSRINRELGASVDVNQVEHVAHYNEAAFQIEIYVKFLQAQEVFIEPLGTRYKVDAGEQISTEISRKFTLDGLTSKLAAYGFTTQRVFSDPDDLFALLLLKRPESRLHLE
jgi:L-histidine N-alpha-methyltransferase|tara:strand:- start:2396 stop:3451 length:1056 start_codon:yes stop_codon:yes gene_type:complete